MYQVKFVKAIVGRRIVIGFQVIQSPTLSTGARVFVIGNGIVLGRYLRSLISSLSRRIIDQ